MRFRGVEIEATTGPETASGRNWAAIASWEAPGVHLGEILGAISDPKIGPERGPGSAGLEPDCRGGVEEG